MGSQFSFHIKLKVANRVTLCSSGTTVRTALSWLFGRLQTTSQMRAPEEAKGFRNKLQYVCKCLHLYACMCIHICKCSKYVCILYVYMRGYSHMTVLCHTYYFSAWSCLMQCIGTHISISALQISLQIVVSLQCFTLEPVGSSCSCKECICNQRIVESFELAGTLNGLLVQLPCNEQEYLQLD